MAGLAAEIDRAVLEAIPLPKRVMAPAVYYGGKGHSARWIVGSLPAPGRYRVYVEPFAGAASVFWHLPRPYPVEVLNDLDERIVTLFRVLQDRRQFQELAHRLLWTLYSLEEFRRALAILERWQEHDEIDRAWAVFVAQDQGFGGVNGTEGRRGRTFISKRGMASTVGQWRGRLRLLPIWHERLTRVQLDCRDALEVIDYWDSGETAFYVDPPYVPESRVAGSRSVYRWEYTAAEHEALIEKLLGIRGGAVLSGYLSIRYAPLEAAGWLRYERKTTCSAAARVRGTKMQGQGALLRHAPRTECLWVSPGLETTGSLFGEKL